MFEVTPDDLENAVTRLIKNQRRGDNCCAKCEYFTREECRYNAPADRHENSGLWPYAQEFNWCRHFWAKEVE